MSLRFLYGSSFKSKFGDKCSIIIRGLRDLGFPTERRDTSHLDDEKEKIYYIAFKPIGVKKHKKFQGTARSHMTRSVRYSCSPLNDYFRINGIVGENLKNIPHER